MLTPFEKDNNTTTTYAECIAFYKDLEALYEHIQVKQYGMTDVGIPLHEIVLAKQNHFNPEINKSEGKAILFINNGIHPGEPEGIDASMLLTRNILQYEDWNAVLDHITIVIIPVYNIDGSLLRGAHSRANQNGPDAYGFRGNAQHLDLNRDFIKCDSRNAQSFNTLFCKWDPHVFVDNHTSNGADYQHIMTLIATQADKLEPAQSQFLRNTMLPQLYASMEKSGWPMCPYVNSEDTPDKGIYGFLDSPRYSTGYAALHHCIGFMPETHMLKSYQQRVFATFTLLEHFMRFVSAHATTLIDVKQQSIQTYQIKNETAIDWKMDKTKFDSIPFLGYEAEYHTSKVTGLQRLSYNRKKPYSKQIPYYNHFLASKNITIPKYYVVPQAYQAVIDRLRWNQVEMIKLETDTSLSATFYRLESVKSPSQAYEGHFPLQIKELKTLQTQKLYYKGDLLIPTDQMKKRYIIETLEPQAPDAFFVWNFFDGVLNQKEYFSDYVFEDIAAELLEKDLDLKTKFEQWKSANQSANAYTQLMFIYQHSSYYEKGHKLYPVAKVFEE